MTPKKICFISSCGGHFKELQQLFPVAEGHHYYIVTEKNITTTEETKQHKCYFLLQQERYNIAFFFPFFFNLFKSLWLVLKERPMVVVSTGAGAVLPTCVFAKIFGAKVIYVETIAKISSTSVTGRLIYKFADRFYVQWQEMLTIYPNALYAGQIY